MTIKSVIGATVSVASAYGPALTINALSNAADAVATLAATTGIGASGDVVKIASSWDRLNDRVAKTTLSGSDLTLVGMDTSSTTLFPATGGVPGTVTEVTTWTGIGQVKEWNATGGEQQYADITTIADYIQKQRPTQRSPVSFDLSVFWDPSLAWWATVEGIATAQTQAPMRILLADATVIYFQGYVSLQKIPTITDRLLTSSVTLSIASEITVY